MKKIFIAATKQNDGKTTVALGLIFNLQHRFKNIGFIKPIGQRYLEEEGLKIDEDSILIERVARASQSSGGLKDMSPVAVERGFTEAYIRRPDKEKITRQIKESFQRVSKKRDIVIIEGTGHAGVGSVFDHSNARVARMLGSKVILVSSGGIGRPIDEIMLNKALFDKEKVELAGVIINKVLPEKFNKVSGLVREGLRAKGIEVLGVVPYSPILASPSIAQILEETEFELIAADELSLANKVARVIVGAMEARDALQYIVDDSLMITGGDREDMLRAALDCYREKDKGRLRISGVILSGGFVPQKNIINLFKEKSVAVLLAKADTYSVASLVRDITVKIRPQDKEKIDTVKGLIHDNVSLDRIIKKI